MIDTLITIGLWIGAVLGIFLVLIAILAGRILWVVQREMDEAENSGKPFTGT